MTFPELVERELERARSVHARPHASPHESYGVLVEEVAEFFDEVRQNPPNNKRMLEELVQVAAMAQRAAEDTGLMDALQPKQMADMGAGFIKALVDRATKPDANNSQKKTVSLRLEA